MLQESGPTWQSQRVINLNPNPILNRAEPTGRGLVGLNCWRAPAPNRAAASRRNRHPDDHLVGREHQRDEYVGVRRGVPVVVAGGVGNVAGDEVPRRPEQELGENGTRGCTGAWD